MNTKQLRQKILDLAIRGKLVPQDPNDEPASVLLEQVRAEKIEGYYVLPNGWEWCKLGDISQIITGSTPSKKNSAYYGDEFPFYKPTDLDAGFNVISADDMLSKEGFDISRKLSKNTVLVTCIGATIGKTGIIRKVGCSNQQINAIVPMFQIIPEYVYFICISDFFQRQIRDNASATTLPIINKGNFEKLAFPLPPLYEQQRIVEAVEAAFAVIDEIDRNKTDLQATVTAAKQKILSLAIRGKLVPQDPNDEPAEVLFPHGIVDKEQIPFDIPESWVWRQLGDIGTTNIGLTYKPTDICSNGVPVIRSSNIKNGRLDFSDLVRVNTPLTDALKLNEGDIVICARNGSRHLVGKCALVHRTTEPLTFGAFMAVYRSVCSTYVYYFLNTDTFRSIFQSEGISTQINQLTQAMIKQTLIPLPPLAEQRRIVAAIDATFEQLDSITQSISS